MAKSKILGLDGRAYRRFGVTLEELEEKVQRQHPDWKPFQVFREAATLWERLEPLHQTIESGLVEAVGRELRRRWTTGLGVPVDPVPGMGSEWDQFVENLKTLEPRERGFVLGVLRQKVCA